MLSIKPFIFNWKNQYSKTKEKEKALSELNYKVTVINSDESIDEQNWLNIGEEAYFNKQFLSALAIFNNSIEDVFFHIQADASYDDWSRLLSDATLYYNKYNWGIYAPNVDYTWYTADKTDINNCTGLEESNLKFIGSPDCTCWFIHKSVIEKFLLLDIKMSAYKFGWGWDIILPAISYLINRPVIRDYSHTISHPKGTNYNKDKAELEMIDLFNKLPDDVKILSYLIKQDREKIKLDLQKII